jgi:hypothetical protein
MVKSTSEKEKRITLPARSPRTWHGMTAGIWFPLLWRGRFAVSPSRMPMAAAISVASFFNSGLRVASEAFYGRRAAKTEITTPLFVLGHWRTGTTLLHELLVKDERFGFPTTYQCMAPHHFLLTDALVTNWLDWLLPATRPMDDMPVGFARPQEDEFALMNLGLKSPYLEWAFPNRDLYFDEWLSLESLTEEQREQWKQTFRWFLHRLSFRHGKQLVLKSPTHTARVRTLLEMFPDAKFVYTVRNPLGVIPSTIRTWNRLNDGMALQVRKDSVAIERVLDVFEMMDRGFEKARDLIPAENLVVLRYEDLVADQMGEVESIYQRLQLGDFEPARPALEKHLEQTREYKPATYDSQDELAEKIRDRCGDYMQRYGYQ